MLSFKELKSFHMKRSPRARAIDASLPANKTFSPHSKKGVTKWLRSPNRFDLYGIDSPKTSSDWKMKTSKHGKSKSRRGRERLTFSDPYERQMAKRLQRQTGMTHMQVSNLIREAKKSDEIDVETTIGRVQGLSKKKTELYESAKKDIRERLNMEKSVTDSIGDNIGDLEMKYSMMAEEYYD